MHVQSSRKSRPSGQALDAALEAAGYDGPPIRFGFSPCSKSEALARMTEAGVPTLLIQGHEYGPLPFPVVARPDNHHAGQYMYVCHNERELRRAFRPRRNQRFMPTHVQRYVAGCREFRVHVVNGLSVKISEKIGGGNHATGAVFTFPHDFGHRKTLRRHARAAVEALGLDFGAVDLMYRDGDFYVLEVNTAPKLTDPRSDTLARYVRAFMREEEDEDAL